jgi:hypothetical protein
MSTSRHRQLSAPFINVSAAYLSSFYVALITLGIRVTDEAVFGSSAIPNPSTRTAILSNALNNVSEPLILQEDAKKTPIPSFIGSRVALHASSSE